MLIPTLLTVRSTEFVRCARAGDAAKVHATASTALKWIRILAALSGIRGSLTPITSSMQKLFQPSAELLTLFWLRRWVAKGANRVSSPDLVDGAASLRPRGRERRRIPNDSLTADREHYDRAE